MRIFEVGLHEAPKNDLAAKLRELEAEYKLLPKNPTSQEGYDALDDARIKIQSLKKQMGLVQEDASQSAEHAMMRINVAINMLQDQVSKHVRMAKADPSNQSVVALLNDYAESLENLVTGE